MIRASVFLFFAFTLFGCSADPSADVVGSWAVDVGSSKIPDGKPEERMMAQAALSTVRVEIREDGTFSLTLMASMKGTWKYDGHHLYLKPEGGAQARLAAASPNGEVQLAVNPDQGQLVWPIESPYGNATLVLARAPADEGR